MNGLGDITSTWPIALATVLSWFLTGMATWYAGRAGLLDHPGSRHSHTQATPRGGGAGLALALLTVSLLICGPLMPRAWTVCIAPGAALLALLGWWDDHRSLGVGLRLAVQLAVSGLLIGCGWYWGWTSDAVWAVLAAAFVLWMVNLYNFMDGSNGMAGLQGVFASTVLAWLYARAGDGGSALLSLLLAASCAGFLPWNLGRARVFMGDVGSLFLGFAIAGLLVAGVARHAFSTPVALMVMAVFLADSTLTLVRRVLKRERWYNPHKQHAYQRLIAHGWSHGRVALLYQAINLGVVLPGIVAAVLFPALDWTIACALAAVLGLGWLGLVRNFGVLAQAG
ncbi:MAG: hypothetical protein PVJ33_09315 [Lysobacterales bacterium]|jgi:Fuc2NAc and GlcNAc transferase